MWIMGSGVDNNKNLVKRLEQLADECEQDEHIFVGKDGLRKIANVLQLYGKRDKVKRFFCSSMKSINDQLLLMELPFKIEQETVQKRIDGKKVKINYYIVIDLRR